MAKCTKCEAEVAGEDVYMVKGEEMCEECSMKYQNPSQPCGGGPGGSQHG